jgi:hypothetical protein
MAELAAPFLCSGCNQWHDVLPLSFSVKVPLAATRVPSVMLEERVVITRDQCVIDGGVIDSARYFLRGRIAVPIIGIEDPFIWGVWAEISPKNFMRTHDLWHQQGREFEPPYPGWLDTDLPLYGTTLNLEVDVQTQPVGRRPHFTILSEDHSLAREQRNGITLVQVEKIACKQCKAQPIAESVAENFDPGIAKRQGIELASTNK